MSDDETLLSELYTRIEDSSAIDLGRPVRPTNGAARHSQSLIDLQRRSVARTIAAVLERAGFDCTVVEDHESSTPH